MKDNKEFFAILNELNGQPVSEYIRLIGDFDFSRYVLKLSQVPVEDLAHPVLFVVRVHQSIAGFPPHLYNTPVRRTGLEDYLTRRVAMQIEQLAQFDKQGVSRKNIAIAAPGQKILPRTSLLVTEDYIEARLQVQLPVQNGHIPSALAQEVFFNEMPAIVNGALIHCNLPEAEADRFVDVMEDADQIRQLLPTRGLVSFASAGSLLMRQGQTDKPDFDQVQPLSVHESLQVEIDTPNAGVVNGLGVPSGITLVLGDMYSGRAQLMRALAAGIYNHVPGDGRELVITVPDAVHIASEPGRSVQKVNIRAFVRHDTGDAPGKEWHTAAEADPIASQAASAVEALEVGARVLLFDELDSSPAFLTRDMRLDTLMPDAGKRLTPLAALARNMVDELGISMIIGGSASVAEFIPVADTILRVDNFTVYEVTEEAKALNQDHPAADAEESDVVAMIEKNRWIVPTSIDPSVGHVDQHIEAPAMNHLIFGRSHVWLRNAAQLADRHQTATIGLILQYARSRYMEEGRPIREILDLIDRDLSTEGLECLTRDLRGDLARPRRYEIAQALNRLDTLRISHIE
jgi:predicted ABC-class ATPase